jgi:hypothetical protein
MPGRTSLLVRCSPEDAATIRDRACTEHRTVSGYLLHVLASSLWVEEKSTAGIDPAHLDLRLDGRVHQLIGLGKRTAVHLRCSVEEAEAIRQAANRRQCSISVFVVFSLHRYWKASVALAVPGP